MDRSMAVSKIVAKKEMKVGQEVYFTQNDLYQENGLMAGLSVLFAGNGSALKAAYGLIALVVIISGFAGVNYVQVLTRHMRS